MRQIIQTHYIHISIVFFAFLLRILNYATPNKGFAMDETFYIPDSYSILKYGYERQWVENYGNTEGLYNKIIEYFINSSPPITFSSEWFSNHPPLGKILTSLGMLIFGYDNPLGWRISAIIAGTMVVVLTMLIASALFNNKAITILAGLFVSLDPMSIAMSRIVHLDIFLTLFVMLGVLFTIKYLHNFELKNAIYLSIFFGLASGVKWSGLYFYAFFAIAIFIILIYKKKLKHKILEILLSITLFLSSYASTWSLWFINYAYPKTLNLVDSINLFFSMHIEKITLHSGITSFHNYKSNASEWILQTHATLVHRDFFNGEESVSAIFTTPNVLIWIMSIVAAIGIIFYSIKNRKYVNNVLVLYASIIAGWLPWFFTGDRTTFQFYTIVFQPYLYILLALGLFLVIESQNRRKISLYRLILYILLFISLIINIFMYSSAVGLTVPYKNSGYELNLKWQSTMANLGLYDIRQMPEENRDVYE